MNATPGNYPSAPMKASDADRDAVLSDLSEHFQAGRLDAEEFDDRSGRALAARTWGELRDLLQDLPAGPGSPRPRPPVSRRSGPSGARCWSRSPCWRSSASPPPCRPATPTPDGASCGFCSPSCSYRAA